jgi:CMP-N,N'-diacetyllegionaminic acid synthase
MKILYLIPARGGSKGLLKKNIKLLNDKPLLHYSIDFARKFTTDKNICLSTDDNGIIDCAKEINLEVNFIRPKHLASDTANTNDVINHAIKYYESKGIIYDLLILLQPTTPFRKKEHLVEMIDSWKNNLELLVSVKEPHDSPYFNLFEENDKNELVKVKNSAISRRQDAPKVYSYNGSIYIFNIKSLKSKKINKFKKIKKYLMDNPIYSVDIDNHFDWLIAETIINNKLL